MMLHDIGVVGMAVMGSNLALNMADHGYDVAVYNYTPDLTEKFLKERPHDKIHGFLELDEFLAALKRPRKIMLMIMAGAPVDSMIDQLLSRLDEGDIIIDGGNSYFGDTQRRFERCKEAGVHFYGMGISGGETGARRGPAIMPGGNKETYAESSPFMKPLLLKPPTANPAAPTSAPTVPATTLRWFITVLNTPTCSSLPKLTYCSNTSVATTMPPFPRSSTNGTKGNSRASSSASPPTSSPKTMKTAVRSR